MKECENLQPSDSQLSITPDSPTKDCSCVCENHQDSDEWEVDNEELLHVEINGIFQDILPSHETTSNSSDDSNDVVRFLGLDSSEPIAQIGGISQDQKEVASSTFFSGHYENTLGTSTFFTFQESNLEENGIKDDSVFSELSEVTPAKRVRYAYKADKKLVLKRVFLNQKVNPVTEGTKGEEALDKVKRLVLTRQAGPTAAPSDL
jgi:hypothetical protein